MGNRYPLGTAVCAGAAVLLVSASALSQSNLIPVTAEHRVALVIGNAAYARGPLRNPVNDARAVADKLENLGFKVILRENLLQKQIGPALREFRANLSAGDVALFFYAGHGMTVRGVNYLPTVDAEIEAEEDVPTQSIDVTKVLELLEGAKTRVNLVFLDACRDNPFARRFRSASRGLAKVDAPSGTLISFATRPGSVAADGEGKNGLYTDYLLRHMDKPGIPIEQVLKRVGADVKLASKGRQEPWSEGLIEGEFYFRLGAPMAAAAPSATLVTDPAVLELALWESVKDSRSTIELKSYLDQYPNGHFAAVARERLRTLEAPSLTPLVSTAPPLSATRPGEAQPGKSFRDCEVCPEMVVIPAGSFLMGSPQTEDGRYPREGPQHRVAIGRPFAAGKFEVTFDEWDACVREGACKYNPSDNGWGRGRRPVIDVSWDNAKEYVAWLSNKTGKTYRLLSEAEWEYVARAGSTTEFNTGSTIRPQQANYETSVSYAGSLTAVGQRKTIPVGSYAPNAFGLYDVHGNVWEWVEDCRNSNYIGAPTDGSAWTSGDCAWRILRGGSWDVDPVYARSAYRYWNYSTSRLTYFGLRVASNLIR